MERAPSRKQMELRRPFQNLWNVPSLVLHRDAERLRIHVAVDVTWEISIESAG